MTGTLRQLTREECLTRLRAHSVGRVAVTHQALPVIAPVNYIVDGSSILFRTRSDGMLANGCRSSVVAFEIDHLDEDGGQGWSVLVIGVAEPLDVDAGARQRAVALGLEGSPSVELDHFVRLTIGKVSGRELIPTPHLVAVDGRPVSAVR